MKTGLMLAVFETVDAVNKNDLLAAKMFSGFSYAGVNTAQLQLVPYSNGTSSAIVFFDKNEFVTTLKSVERGVEKLNRADGGCRLICAVRIQVSEPESIDNAFEFLK